MIKSKHFPKFLDLQLFAEGGDGGTGAEGATGVSAPAAEVQNTGETAPVAEVKDRNADFEALIKGEYKDLYDARVQDTVQKRLKSTKETVDRYNALSPTLEVLARKYGVESGDIEALNRAIEEDDSYYEDEAYEKGITVKQLKEIRKMERENADLKRQMNEQTRKENANRLYAKWMDEADKTKSVYPTFNLEAEMKNPKFIELLRSNIDVRTAYEVMHKDDIIAGAMQFAVQKAEEKVANSVKANGARPSENGNSSQSATLSKSGVSTLSRAERAELNARILRGEKVSFS